MVLMILSSASAGAAEQAVSKDAVAAALADSFRVEVLGVRDAEVDGRPAYAVTVMNRGGNFNAAFQVNTVLVDAVTGRLIPGSASEFPGMAGLNAGRYGVASEADGLAIRRRSLGN